MTLCHIVAIDILEELGATNYLTTENDVRIEGNSLLLVAGALHHPDGPDENQLCVIRHTVECFGSQTIDLRAPNSIDIARSLFTRLLKGELVGDPWTKLKSQEET